MPVILNTFLRLSALFFLASTVYLAVQIATNTRPHHGLPVDIYTRLPLFDLVGYVQKMPNVHQSSFFNDNWPYVYPAPCVIVFKFFSLFKFLPIRHAVVGSILIYLALVLAGLLFLRHRLALALQHRGILPAHARLFSWGTLLLSWPILYAVHQGNIEALLWMLAAIGIWLYRQGQWWACALTIGVAGSFKIYPLVFLLLLFPVKQWRAVAGGVLAFVAVTAGSLLYIGPTFIVALKRVRAGIALFNSVGLSLPGIVPDSKPFDHSLDGLLHRVLSTSPAALALLIRWYMSVVTLLFLLLFFGRIRKLPVVNQVLFLALSAVTLPSISFDYTLQLLYVPFAWILLDGIAGEVAGRTPQWLLPTIVCFALLFSPELFLNWNGVLFYGQFKAVVLLMLFALSCTVRFHNAPESIAPVSSYAT